MKTKLDYYRIFYETAKFSSFSLAAQHLYISQSAISQCIHQLETDLQTRLFSRSRTGIALTKEGTLLFQKIETAMQAIMQGESLLERLRHLESGALTIAAGDTITTHFLLPYLEQFHKTYPGIRIEMANSYSSHMLQLVKDGKADLAFVNLPAYDEELCIAPCLQIHDIFVCGAAFPIKSKYSLEEIAALPLILLEKNSSSRRFLDKVFAEKHIALVPQIEIAAHELLLQFASIHLGVACVVEEFSKEALSTGKVKKLPLTPQLPPRSIGCAYLRGGTLSQAAQAFLKLTGQNI
ncbi:MAG: LysR family transcriptional regulator [Ruminococcaceae bacterium]|nr:LysR family transcriptional regulator [Oscillospiraceae bacterium]